MLSNTPSPMRPARRRPAALVAAIQGDATRSASTQLGIVERHGGALVADALAGEDEPDGLDPSVSAVGGSAGGKPKR